ncbi:HlyD family type I secretion periplasmic adaptor subunit [Brevundimonas aveniformis]|uniref:HlyD family type I secretion periplasmic adaptor subunit n=1 Tax=Brevundimonas aveniformis TaxID=370977 RepID=UPI0003F5825E|nr:HlyD family type I secretion periplasmic adaptor subunit [Brevundimonas aveniformis]
MSAEPAKRVEETPPATVREPATTGAAEPMAGTPSAEGPPPSTRPADSMRRELRIGGIIAAAFFVIFLGWAAFAPLDAGAYAPGKIVVSGNRQAVQHRDGGVVSALHVHEGQEVRQGQVLVEISAGELRAAERGLTGQVLALLAQRSRLVAERDGLRSVPTPPEFQALSGDDVALANEALALQRQQFSARGGSRGNEIGVLSQRVEQLNQQIIGLDRQIASNREQSRLIGEELAGMQSLADRGFAPLNRVRALERQAAALDGEEGALRAQVARAQEAIGETRLQMLGVGSQTDEEVADLLRQVQVQLDELNPRLTAAREQLARAQVRAPASGRVVGLSVFTIGGVVQPGQMLMEVVPEEAALIVSAEVSPTDADDLRMGQDTEVRFSAFRERDLPILHGTVTDISADSFTDERTGRSFFRVTVEVPPSELAKIEAVRGEDTGLIPGLPVEVVVPLRKRTALQYFFEPLTQSVWRSFREH